MLSMLRTRLHDDEDGFTLIELMVVVLIIAILIAIAIPTFLGVQNRAKDRAAQSDLRNALTAAKTVATDDSGEFDTVDLNALKAAEGSLGFTAAAPADHKDITTVGGGVASPASSDYILFYTKSASGKYFGIATDKNGHVGYCSGDVGDVNDASVTTAADGTTSLAGCADKSW